jgi:osmotically-inducible protein OsmY
MTAGGTHRALLQGWKQIQGGIMARSSFRVWLGAAAVAMLTVGCAETDPGVTTAVKAKLAADDTVKAYRIDVDTQDKVVTLKGEVDTPTARTRAVELAKATTGVRDVVDQLTVKEGMTPPGGIDDSARAGTAEAGRTADARIDEAQKKAGAAADRTAGAVATAGERAGDAAARTGERAGDAAGKAGDRIGDAANKTGEAAGDATLTAKVKSKFLADSKIAGMKIDVDTTDSVVTLTGTVGSALEKQHAVAVARETDGVKSVVDRLKVGKF